MDSGSSGRFGASDSDFPAPEHFSRHRLETLRDRILESLVGAGPHQDHLLAETVDAAVHSFVKHRGDTDSASSEVATYVEQIGARLARSGGSGRELTHAFRRSLVTTQKSLTLVLGDLVTYDALIRIRESLVAFLSELHVYAHASMVRTHRQLSMTPERRRERLSRLFEDSPLSLDGGNRLMYSAIVSAYGKLPSELISTPDVIGVSHHEALVPERIDVRLLEQHFDAQAVVGPTVLLNFADEGLAVTRQAAHLLRDGLASHDDVIVPCEELLDSVIVHGNPLVAEMLIDRHLSGMREFPPARRVAMAELMLHLLENGQALSVAARNLGISRQTAFSRFKPLKVLFGEKLENPDARLELIVAVRAALPRWRAELAQTSASTVN